MIDFYERLRVPFGTDGIALQAAIAALRKSDAPTAERAAAILLKPSRRKGYDRLWLALTRIGQARALGALNDAPFGSRQEYADFRFHAGEARPSDQGTYTGETEAGDSIPMWRTVLGKLLGLVPLLAFLAFFGWMATETSRPPLQQPSQTSPPNALAEPPSGVQPTAPALSIQPLPETGDGKTTVNAGDDNWIQIKTSGLHHTLVRVEHPNGDLVALRFIRAAETHRIYLPLGTYVIKTATGRQWFGDAAHFGPDTVYSKPDDLFPLNKRGEYWEVELIPQQNGNLSQRGISASEFGGD